MGLSVREVMRARQTVYYSPAAIIRITIFNFMHNTLPLLFLRHDWLRVHELSHYLTSASPVRKTFYENGARR